MDALVDSTTLFKMLPLPSANAVPLPLEMPPPCSASVTLLPRLALPPPVASELALRTRFSLPVPVALRPALMLMLLWAVRVSDTSLALFVVMALFNVMSPLCALVPALPVVMVTLMPLFSAAWIVATVINDESLVVVKFGLPVTLVSDPAVWIVTLFGSSNHKPPLPRGALASAACATSSMCLPEVSMLPPLPPSAPPRAAIFPYTRAVSLAHTTTRPPLPRRSALANNWALAAR